MGRKGHLPVSGSHHARIPLWMTINEAALIYAGLTDYPLSLRMPLNDPANLITPEKLTHHRRFEAIRSKLTAKVHLGEFIPRVRNNDHMGYPATDRTEIWRSDLLEFARERGDASSGLLSLIEEEDRLAAVGQGELEAVPTPSRRRGRRPIKLEAVRALMTEHLTSGALDPTQFAEMKETSLAADYACSRDTARKARNAVTQADWFARLPRSK